MTKRRKIAFRIFVVTISLFAVGVVWFWCIPGNRYEVLDRSIWYQHRFTICLLLALGADVNGRDYDVNITPWEPNHPVMSAVFKKDAELLRLFLSHGGQVDFLWGEGYSPLWFAVHNGDVACVRELIRNGANPDFPTWMEERTPRLLAGKKVNKEILESFGKTPNKALVPTPASVTPAAGAPVAPDAGAAHL